MRALLWFLVLAAAAIALALLARAGQGFVIIVYPPWRIELSLTLAVLLTVALGVAGVYILRFVRAARALPGEIRRWRRKNAEQITEN